jgi:hypothetical protein
MLPRTVLRLPRLVNLNCRQRSVAVGRRLLDEQPNDLAPNSRVPSVVSSRSRSPALSRLEQSRSWLPRGPSVTEAFSAAAPPPPHCAPCRGRQWPLSRPVWPRCSASSHFRVRGQGGFLLEYVIAVSSLPPRQMGLCQATPRGAFRTDERSPPIADGAVSRETARVQTLPPARVLSRQSRNSPDMANANRSSVPNPCVRCLAVDQRSWKNQGALAPRQLPLSEVHLSSRFIR